MIQLKPLQDEVGEWASENFGDEQPPSYCIMGANEELGELIHSHLKRLQGIRLEDDDVGEDAERDAIGDIVIYLLDFCHRDGLDIDSRRENGHDTDTATEAVNRLNYALGRISKREVTHQRYESEAYIGLGQTIYYLEAFCEHKGYDFVSCIEFAASEVLDREWDADVTVE